ncbi:hypothetical protein AK830_g11143 [Neonectria ditissima]|uniref:Ysc84 actin-binding domain-containing protein n=1 Tax=Neonectria ditissima TaxID=78410 RepID=A0A0P7B3Z8_9HYPO|nr:hypothetical protein AK830_g11143 [Neonectria ditissima]
MTQTAYSVSNHSIESIDPLKQVPPTYSPHQETPDYQQTPPAPMSDPIAVAVPNKPTMGERFHRISSKAGWPLNKAANVIGAEGWWPTSMDKECNKAARILHSFTRTSQLSIYPPPLLANSPSAELGSSPPPKASGPMHPTGLTRKAMVKIPPAVLGACAGLAIFNVLRAGACHSSLAAGSGVIVARRADGTWSPPSAFVVTTLGAGFMFGLDVYDCVCVLNTQEQVSAFTNPRVSLGAEGSIAVGPVGTGGHVESAVGKTAKPMWSYMKSRGLWAGVQIDGTIILSRSDANGLFYNERGITAHKILREDVAWPMGAKPLFEVLKALEGRMDYDRTVVQEVGMVLPPGDAVLSDKRSSVSAASEHQESQIGETDQFVYDEKMQYRDEPVPEYKDDKPQYKDDDTPENKDDEEYDMVADEKARLAKSGY